MGWRSSSASCVSWRVASARAVDVAQLEQVVAAPVQAAHLQLGLGNALGELAQIGGDRQPLVRIGGEQQRGVAALQRGDERDRVPAAARELQRARAELLDPLSPGWRSTARSPAAPAAARPAGPRLCPAPQRRLEQLDRLPLDRAGVRVGAGGPARPARAGSGKPSRAAIAAAVHERARRVRVALRAAAVPSADQQLAAARRVVVQPLQRGRVMGLGLVVGDAADAASAACSAVVHRLALAVQVTALDVVVGDLGGCRPQPWPEVLQRLRDPVVQPHPA